MIIRICLLFLVSSSLLTRGRGGSGSLEVGEKVVATTPKMKPSSFPGMDSETCNEPCSPSIIAQLYDHWNEDTKSLEDPPFSPILYWKDKDRDPISYSESTESYNDDAWTCNNNDLMMDDECRNLAWYMEHCRLSEDHPMSSFTIYTDGADKMFWMSWYRSSCEEFMGPDALVLEENLPFLEGQVNGTVAIVKKAAMILFPDPNSDSCWRVVCFAQMDDANDYQACLEDAQLNLVQVSLESFVEIKDVWCE